MRGEVTGARTHRAYRHQAGLGFRCQPAPLEEVAVGGPRRDICAIPVEVGGACFISHSNLREYRSRSPF